MNYENILTSIEDGIMTITINRPDKLNALNKGTFTDIKSAVTEVRENAEIKSAIITGAGAKAFVAGADISEFSGLTVESGSALAARGQRIFDLIEKSPKPIIAAVNGFALGGGCELSMACHFRVASDNARFRQPEVNLAIIPGYGGTQRLVQLIGKGKAMELLMTADMLGAQEALSLGLVNYVTSQEDLIPKCKEILNKIGSKAPLAIGGVVACVNAYYEAGINGFDKEVSEFGECCKTEDFVEGAAAFVEKRKANFKGK